MFAHYRRARRRSAVWPVSIMAFLIACGLAAIGLVPSQAEALFFVQVMPAIAFTTVAPIADVASLGPEDYARYYDFPSVLNTGLELKAGRAELVFRIDIRPDFYSFVTDTYNNNLPFLNRGISSIGDVNMPTVGYFSYEGENLSLSIGRRQLKWGPATYGLAISDNAPYLDHAAIDYRFSAKHGDWWYSFVAIGADRPGEAWAQLATDGYKNIFAHRVGYESDRIRIAVGELNLVHDIIPGLIDISPFAIYHNLYQDAYSNVFLDATAEAKFGVLRSYGEFAMDDLVMPWENANARPTALGFLGGIEWKIAAGKPYGFGRMREADYALREANFSSPGGLSLRFEHYRTSTYIYNREIESGKWMLPDHRLVNISTGYVDTADAFYMGFPYGPGVRLDLLSLAWESTTINAALSLKYISEGSRGIDFPYGTLTDGAATWFALQEPISRNVIAGFSARAAVSDSVELWTKGEFWVGDTPKASLSTGVAFRYSTK